MAGSAHAAHDFVEDEEHTVFVADVANCCEVAVFGGDTAKCLHIRLATGPFHCGNTPSDETIS